MLFQRFRSVEKFGDYRAKKYATRYIVYKGNKSDLTLFQRSRSLEMPVMQKGQVDSIEFNNKPSINLR